MAEELIVNNPFEYASPLSEATHLHDHQRLFYPSTTNERYEDEESGESDADSSTSLSESESDHDDGLRRPNPFLDQLDRVTQSVTPASSRPTTATAPRLRTPITSPFSPATAASSTPSSSSSTSRPDDVPRPSHYYRPPVPPRITRPMHSSQRRTAPALSYPLPPTPVTSPSSSPRKRPARPLASATTTTTATSSFDEPLVVKSTRPSPFPLGPKPAPRRIVPPRRKSLIGPQPHIVDLAVEKFNLKTTTLSTSQAAASSTVPSSAASTSTAVSSSPSSYSNITTTPAPVMRQRKQPMTDLEIERERQWQQWESERIQQQRSSIDFSTPPTHSTLCQKLPVIIRYSSPSAKPKAEKKTKEKKPKGPKAETEKRWWSIFCCGNRGHEDDDEKLERERRERESREKEQREAEEEEEEGEEEENPSRWRMQTRRNERRLLRRRV